jgi:hypothetical protein
MKRVRFMAECVSAALLLMGSLALPCLAQHNRGFAHFPQQHRESMGAAKSAPQSHPQSQNHAKPPAHAAAPNHPQSHAGDWLRNHQNMSPAQREKELENDPGFRRLPAQQQQLLRQRLQHFSNLPREQQDRMLRRMDVWAHLTPEQKQQAHEIHNRIQQLPPDRQRMVRTAIDDMRTMPPEQREQIIDSARFKGMFSPQERDIMRGATKLPLAGPEQ